MNQREIKSKLKILYENYWLDVGAILLVTLFLGSGLLLIKVSKRGIKPIEITDEKGAVETDEEKGIKGSFENNQGEREIKLININTASQRELEKLPRIGEKTAEKIISYREENGPFQTKEELKNVPGIGETKYLEIENLITVE